MLIPVHPKPSPGDIHHETVNNGDGEGGKEEENMKTEAEEKEAVKEDEYEQAYEYVYNVYQKSTCWSPPQVWYLLMMWSKSRISKEHVNESRSRNTDSNRHQRGIWA